MTAKGAGLSTGAPEDRLRAPFENLISDAAALFASNIVCAGETPLPDRLGRPDYAVLRDGALAGYVELKAPGVGADARRFRGRDREQFRRFSSVPNILYGDGNEWALYRGGERAGFVRFSGDVAADGAKAVSAEDARAFMGLLRDFLLWEPIPPLDRNGKIDLKGFAAMLAPLCRMLRDDVTDALRDDASPLAALARDWRQLLFPDATDPQFADSYAQTVAFALLLGRSEGADPLTLESAQGALAAQHSLLSRALQILTDPRAQSDLAASLDLLLRVVSAVPPVAFAGATDPWLHFYEDFLADYDPKLRKDAGAYYTPVEVVRAQVRLIDDLLTSRLGKPLGFADPGVVTLDPAVGTGTYLLGVIAHALARVEAEQGGGAVAGQATALARNLYGFEFLAGPYAVSELRIGRALADRGASLPPDGAHIYLTDTLESPDAEQPQLPLFLQPIAEQRARALRVKSGVRVLVCLGNPPYDRHEAARSDNEERTGGWVRRGDGGAGENAILRDFTAPATAAGYGVHLKNLYNLYVYFWRWALWKVFENETAAGPGVVGFITASSYLDGNAFTGMREHMRRLCDEIWVLDLGGEQRGARKSENVFAIRTPVAITVAARFGEAKTDAPATVRHGRVEGTRDEKLAALDAIDGFGAVAWRDCPNGWQAPFRPAPEGNYGSWPLLTDLMPWQHSGVQLKRTWPIAPDEDTLKRRWQALLATPPQERPTAFRETRDRKAMSEPSALFGEETLPSIAALPRNAPLPRVARYAYRSFDRQWILLDARLSDYARPALWRVHGARQAYLTSLLSRALGDGPAATACAAVPDLHHFPGGSGKSVVPLYRSADASEANILPGLLDILGGEYGRAVSAEDVFAYVYGALAHPAFTARFADELEARELRLPLTRDAALFERVRDAGARLLRLHTYGERFTADGERHIGVPAGTARCTRAVPGESDAYPENFRYDDSARILHVGDGAFAPVAPEVYDFPVSGQKVVPSWLRRRTKRGAGRASSPLDDIRPQRWPSAFTTELLELLWALEATVALQPEQARLLDALVEADSFCAADLPNVPADMRRAPRQTKEDPGLL